MGHVSKECDKQGFPIKQGVLTPGIFCNSTSIFLSETPCFRGQGRRNGERRRKSIRGCIVSQEMSVLNLVILKKGKNDPPRLTDMEHGYVVNFNTYSRFFHFCCAFSVDTVVESG
ncbi:hypothetical protein MKX03_026764 [Papaver bracteatum]|nr:hypothetical protein MKX03_026764 [Papaver bracteatum]